MQISAKELAAILKGTIEGDPNVVVHAPSRIEEGGKGTISFLGNKKYEKFATTTTASILLVDEGFQSPAPIKPTLLRVKDVYSAIAVLLEHFNKSQEKPSGIDATAFIAPSAHIGEGTAVSHFVVIGKDSAVGKNSLIYDHVYIGQDVTIGAGCIIYPGVRIMNGSKIGDRVIIHPNAVIGSDGFGYVHKPDGSYEKITHVGNVILEDDVEIGANTTIDRASIGSTIIRKGVKLDNLVQIGHNVEVDEHTAMASQAGVAGSTKIGKYCRIGGQAGFSGHIHVADKTMIQAQSGLAASVKEAGTAIFGSPAIGYRDYIRSYSVFKQLPDLYKRIHQLEKTIESLKKE
jgi:UDP-3-O-[3-hydroxymyristoyl] glucosamine N-acyltransferase